MDYVSTRGTAPRLGFDDVVLAGLARDGGLYVPDVWPRLSASEVEALRPLDYPTLAARLLARFAEPAIDEATLAAMAEDAYAGFDHPEVAPLTPLGGDDWLLELFHGPTLAFKDYALQLLGRLFEHVLAQRGDRITIVGATSGDTGSAAIEACRDRRSIEIFVLHPMGRVSEVQRRQMTTVVAPNVHNIAIEGSFDDCQDLVKALFNNHVFRDRRNLAAINSINWARIAAQVVYYAWATLRLGEPNRPVSFAVPTGNFGNVFAAYAAREMGFPIGTLIVGSNANDILTRFFASGRMRIAPVRPTLSPSMDIQISSNFERYLFELYDRDPLRVANLLSQLRSDGGFEVDLHHLARAREIFAAHALDDDATTASIRAVYDAHGVILDPHSAIGVAAGRSFRAETGDDGPIVSLATAHPAKFPDAVEAAVGVRPALPQRVAAALDRSERYCALPAKQDALEDCIEGALRHRGIVR